MEWQPKKSKKIILNFLLNKFKHVLLMQLIVNINLKLHSEVIIWSKYFIQDNWKNCWSLPRSKSSQRIRTWKFIHLEIWEFAKKNDFTIVTFDADFFDLTSLKGHPPKIIWLRIGNTTTENIANLFKERHELIKDFVHNSDNKDLACLEIE